jgi:hypothetical protein
MPIFGWLCRAMMTIPLPDVRQFSAPCRKCRLATANATGHRRYHAHVTSEQAWFQNTVPGLTEFGRFLKYSGNVTAATPATGAPDDMTYSRISSLALVSAISGAVSSLGLLVPEIAAVSLIGVATGAVAIRSLRQYELRGRGMAVFGIVVSLFFLSATPIWHAAWFNLESSSGFARLDFASLTKDNQRAFRSLVGQNICLKGYAYPAVSAVNLFVFTPDGAERSLDNMILVQLPAGETWRWQSDPLAASGTLAVNPAAADDSLQPRYILTNSTIRKSCTRFQLANLVTSDGC